MTAAILNRGTVSSQAQLCIACHTYLGSAEKAVQGVRGHMEGPLHDYCATEGKRHITAVRSRAMGNGNGASARQ